nr:zinc-binding dehydrogenase [Pseudonocardia sp. H11422]
MRVPLADHHLEHVPSEISDEAAVFLSCNLPAAVIAVDAAEIEATDTVAVIGSGPTGLLALELARQRTRGEVLAFDRVAGRLARAGELGAHPVNVVTDDVDAAVAAASGGRGVDKVIEFGGRGDAFNLAVSIARPGGVISGGDVYLEQAHPVSLFDMYFKNLQIRLNGFANAKTAQWKARQLVAQGVIDPTTVLSHRVTLAEFPKAAASYAAREDGFFKMLVRP